MVGWHVQGKWGLWKLYWRDAAGKLKVCEYVCVGGQRKSSGAREEAQEKQRDQKKKVEWGKSVKKEKLNKRGKKGKVEGWGEKAGEKLSRDKRGRVGEGNKK